MTQTETINERKPGFYLSESDQAEFREYLNVPCCANCRYWSQQEPPGWSSDPPVIPDGELQVRYVQWTSDCTRNSPAIASASDRREGIGWQFPITPFNVWCGQFEPHTDETLMNHDHRESLQ